MTESHLSVSEANTQAIGRQLAAQLSPGDVVLISGQLGAGKTAFVRGIAEAFGVEADEVSSPTFTLVHEYRGTALTVYHVDLYRLERADASDLGILEMAHGGGIVAIEWPERLAPAIQGSWQVSIETVDDRTRRIVYSIR